MLLVNIVPFLYITIIFPTIYRILSIDFTNFSSAAI